MEKIEAISPDSKQFTFRKYYLALNKLAQPTEHTPLKDPQKIKDFEEFYKWVKGMGASWKWVDYPVFYKNRAGFEYPGMITTHDIDCNQDFIFVPQILSMTSGKAWLSDLQPFFKSHPSIYQLNKNFEDNMMITFLLSERAKKEKSFWYPMFKIWPNEVGLIVFLDEKELDLFEDEKLKKHLIAHKSRLTHTYIQMKDAASKTPQLIDPSIMTWDNFKVAYECLFSRCFNNASDQYNVSPLAEFINHDNVHTHYYITVPDKEYVIEKFNSCEESSGVDSDVEQESDHEVGVTECTDETDYKKFLSKLHEADSGEIRIATYNDEFKKGTQPYITYKNGCNEKLLLGYGFLLENNIHDYYQLSVKDILDKKEIPAPLLTKLKIADVESSYIQLHITKFSKRLHLLAKMLFDGKLFHPFEYYEVFESHDKEIEAMRYEQALLKKVISSFKTTYEQDEELITSKKITSYSMYCAVVYKKEKKNIILYHIARLEFLILASKGMAKGLKKKEALNAAGKELGMTEFKVKLMCRGSKAYLDTL